MDSSEEIAQKSFSRRGSQEGIAIDYLESVRQPC